MEDVLGTCPWCLVEVRVTGQGGMTAVLDQTKWWHQGCVADVTRAGRELEELLDEA